MPLIYAMLESRQYESIKKKIRKFISLKFKVV